MTSYPGRDPDPREPLLAPARRSGMVMLILGGLGLLYGSCMVAVGFVNPADLQAMMGANAPPAFRMDVAITPEMLWTSGGVFVAVSAALLVAGAIVRRGTRRAVIGAMVLTSVLLFIGVMVLLSGIAGAAAGEVPAVISTLMSLVALTVLVVLMAWLVQAARAAGRLAAARSAYAAEYRQSQQMRQTYGGIPEPPPGQPPVGPGQWPLQPPAPPKE